MFRYQFITLLLICIFSCFNPSLPAQAEDDEEILTEKILSELKKMGITKHILNVGDKAASFALPNAKGEMISLESQLKKGPVILTFYRGVWCPYCNEALRKLQKKLPEIEALGATLVAISPQTGDNTVKTSKKHKVKFQILSDIDNKIGRKYGLVYTASEEYVKFLKNFFIDIAEYNGNNKYELPITATYIINTDRSIFYAFIDPDYRKRAKPEVLIEQLKRLKESNYKKLFDSLPK